MNKQTSTSNDPAETGLTPQAITETMQHPEFGAEQLPELWQNAVEPYVTYSNWLDERVEAWDAGLAAMFERCETYPQHAKIRAVLAGMPDEAWYYSTGNTNRGDIMLQQASTEQLLEALTYEQQHMNTQRHPTPYRAVTEQILLWAAADQLAEPVIDQLAWVDHFLGGETALPDGGKNRRRRIIGHTQQNLLEGNNHAWTVFLGIVEYGAVIGETAELALAIEHQHRPDRNQT